MILAILAILLFAFFTVGLPAAVGTARGQAALCELDRKGGSTQERAADFRHIREVVGNLLLLCALGIGSATLPYGAWQRASKTEILSAETVVLFGLYWSTFLAVGYVPVHLTMHQVGLKIRDDMVREWRGSDSDCAIWDEPREKVSQALGLSDNPLDFPKSALAVLTPLFSGILSIMIAKAG